MNGEKITLIDKDYDSTYRLKDSLVEVGFSVEIIKSDSNLQNNIKKTSPDLVIYISATSGTFKDENWKKASESCQSVDIPIIAISPFRDMDLYLKDFEAGISHHISSPCKKKYFTSRVIEILDMHHKEKIDIRPVHINFQYAESRYFINSDTRELLHFITSIIQNSVEQNSLAIEKLKKEKKLRQKNTELIDLKNTIVLSPEHKELEEEVYRAIKNDEFELYYQPIVSLQTGTVTGFESLIRWNHPEKGIVSPDSFIPIAEKTDLIFSIGDIVIEKASEQLGLWHKKGYSEEPLTLSFNVSGRQFIQPDLCTKITEAADRHGVDHGSLRMEITESTIMDDMDASNLMLLELKAKGFGLYMDDFGTGYSSLSYLRHFPVDILKIDKSFVEWINIDDESEIIVKTIIGLAHNLNMKVIAEGVETEEHLTLLRNYGCDYGQGFFFAKPLAIDDAEKLLKDAPRW